MRTLNPQSNGSTWTWPYRGSSTDLVDDFFSDFDRVVSSLMQPTSATNINFLPTCDIEESKDHYFVSFDMPGVKIEDINIEVRDNSLMISAERNREIRNEQSDGLIRHERTYGKFQRSLALPSLVDPDRIEAQYENGVLNVAIPKSEASKAKKIQIQSEKGGLFSRLMGSAKSGETKNLKDAKIS